MTKRTGPGELYGAENRESLGPYVETVTHGTDGDSRDGKRERDAAHRAPENTRTCNTTTAGQQGKKRMKEGGSKESGAGKKEEDEPATGDRRPPAHNDGQTIGSGKRGPESLAKQRKDGELQEQREGEGNTGNDERRESDNGKDIEHRRVNDTENNRSAKRQEEHEQVARHDETGQPGDRNSPAHNHGQESGSKDLAPESHARQQRTVNAGKRPVFARGHEEEHKSDTKTPHGRAQRRQREAGEGAPRHQGQRPKQHHQAGADG